MQCMLQTNVDASACCVGKGRCTGGGEAGRHAQLPGTRPCCERRRGMRASCVPLDVKAGREGGKEDGWGRREGGWGGRERRGEKQQAMHRQQRARGGDAACAPCILRCHATHAHGTLFAEGSRMEPVVKEGWAGRVNHMQGCTASPSPCLPQSQLSGEYPSLLAPRKDLTLTHPPFNTFRPESLMTGHTLKVDLQD